MATPAGWYPDPGSGAHQRYWDGERWTEHTAPLAPAAPAAAEPAAAAGPFVASLATEPDDQRTSRRSPGRLLGGLAAAALVVVAGFFAYGQLASADGGADSPEEAVAALMDAVGEEDLVGMGEVLLPGERRAYVDPVLEGVDHLRRWGVLDGSLDTSDVSGIEVEVDDLDVRAEAVSDDVVNVFASGSIRARIDGETLPIGDLLDERALRGQDRSELDAPEETSEFSDVVITTVREDGRWYVSMMHTVAETARQRSGEPMPPSGVAAVGAATPGAAVEGMVGAIGRLDLAEIIARLHPDEAGALQRYAPIFLGDAQAEIDAAVAESGLEIEITDLAYDVHERDGIAVVSFEGFSMRGRADGEEMSMEFSGDCATVTVGGETEEQCGPETPLDLSDTPFGDIEEIFADMDRVGLVVAPHDGQWYISPVRSYTEVVLAVMRAIERHDIERAIDSIEDGSLEAWMEDRFDELVDQSFGTIGTVTVEEEIEVIGGGVTASTIDAGPGTDVDVDGLRVQRDRCAAGDAGACDDLWWSSPIGSEEEDFGRTCGGRFPDAVAGSCTTLMSEG